MALTAVTDASLLNSRTLAPVPALPAEGGEQRIQRRLADAIYEHRLPPGTKLPEADLCRIFDASRGTVRKVLEHLGLTVNRLIRVSYGPFHLTDLKPGQVEEIPPDILAQALEALGAPMAPAPPADARPAPKSHLGRGPRADRLKTRRKIPRRT